MATGFLDPSGTDTDSLFAPGNAGITTGFLRSDGVDLGSLYQPYTNGEKRGPTGLLNSAGVDLSDLFQSSAFTYTAVNETCADVGINDPPYTVFYPQPGIKYNTDGSTTRLAAVSGDTSGTNWGSPIGAGVGNGRYVRVSSYSGDDPSGPAIGVWHELSAARLWYMPGTRFNKNSVLNIQFSNNALDVHHSVVVTLEGMV